MSKIKSFIREAFSLERITVCLAVFTVFIVMPFSILSFLVSLAVEVLKVGCVKIIMGVMGIGGAFIAIFLFGVVLSIIYTIWLKIYNHYRYKDEYFYEDIDYEDEDTDE